MPRVIACGRGPFAVTAAMDLPDEHPLCPPPADPRASLDPAGMARGPRRLAIVMAALGLVLSSGCAFMRSAPPAPPPVPVATCIAPSPMMAVTAVPAPATRATAVRVVAHPTVVKPVIPPLPPGVFQPTRERVAYGRGDGHAEVAQRRAAATAGKSTDEARL